MSKYMIKSYGCVGDLFKVFKENKHLTVLAKGELFSPTFEDYKIVTHKSVLPNLEGYQFLMINGIFVKSFACAVTYNNPRLMCNAASNATRLEQIHQTIVYWENVFESLCKPLPNSPAVVLSRVLYGCKDVTLNSPSLLQAVLDLRRLNEMNFSEISRDCFMGTLSEICDGDVPAVFVNKLYDICTEGYSTSVASLNCLGFVSYFADCVHTYGRECRNNILMNALKMCEVLSQKQISQTISLRCVQATC